jgi:hypothetical protein
MNNGIGLPGLLIVFTILKLTHVINWSWVWIVSPIWISVILCFLIFFVLAIFQSSRGK